MTAKTLATKKVRIAGTDKGVEVVAHRNKVGDYTYYSVLNGFYEGLVEFVAVEFANGVRTL